MAGCLETIDVCIWRMFVFVCCSDWVGVCGNVSCVVAVVTDSWGFQHWSVEVYCMFV